MDGKILLIALISLAIALSGCTQPVSCTEEAKECPDGSFVSRNPALNCEFNPCPALECKGEGETIPVIASPPECCPGLDLIPPKEPDILGINGVCTSKCGNGVCDTETESLHNCMEDCPPELCEIGREYEHTAVSPVTCVCPEGYEFHVLEMGWGPCPHEDMSDCPSSTLTCVES